MSFSNWFKFGEQIAEPIKAVSTLYTTDKQRLDAEATLANVVQKSDAATADVNKVNAQDPRFFESGWRPMIGWTSGACIALYYVPQLILANFIWYTMCMSQHKILPFPIEPTDILNLVYLLLGFGTYKTIESFLKKG